MTQIVTTPSSTPTGAPVDPDRSRFPRQLTIFLLVALGVGWPLLALSTRIQPDAPFLLAAVLLGLALPALVLTHRQAGRAGVRALLRDCVRPPTRWWWLLLAAFGLPVRDLVGGRGSGRCPAVHLGPGGVLHRRPDHRRTHHQHLGGDGLDRVLPTPRRLPVGPDPGRPHHRRLLRRPPPPPHPRRRPQPEPGGTNLLYLVGVAVGVRLLIARVDGWSGRSLLVVGLLHSSFNATENLLQPDFFWVRIAITIALGVAVTAFGRQPHPPSQQQPAGDPGRPGSACR